MVDLAHANITQLAHALWTQLYAEDITWGRLFTVWLDDDLLPLVAVSAAIQIVLFFGVGMRWLEGARLSWFMSLVSAAVMSFGSIPIAGHALLRGMDLSYMPEWGLTRFLTCFFFAFLCLDLVFGLLFYRRHVQMLTGWLHHTGYIMIVSWIAVRGVTYGFCLHLVCEWPTLLLAAAQINKSLRHDMVFGLVFFVTRIVYHAVIIYAVAATAISPYNLSLMCFAPFPLHLYWFYAWVRQQQRLYAKRHQNGSADSKKKHEL